MKKIIIVTFVVLVTGAGVGYYIKKLNTPVYELATVQKKDIVQEIFMTGKVEALTSIDLHFKTSGKLAILRSRVGKKVSAGELLAKQDSKILDAELATMQANISIEKAKLNQLKAGASPEDIAVSETAVVNAQQLLNGAKKNLVDILQDAYTKSDDAIRNKVDQFFNNSQIDNPQISFLVADSQLEINIEQERLLMNTILKTWKISVDQLTTDSDFLSSISETRNNLNQARLFLDNVALAMNNSANKPYSISQTTWDGWKIDVSTARININTAFSNLSGAEEKLRTAESGLKTAQDQLVFKKAPMRSTDITVYEAQIKQAEAQMRRVQAQINDLEIVAPISGVITAVNGEIGEIVESNTIVISLISNGKSQIKANLSEDNVAGVAVNQSARITVDALPDEWRGTVTEIDPAGTIKSGSVYYTTTLAFDQPSDRVRVGMTANVWIKTGEAVGTLTIPMNATQKNGPDIFVRVYQNGKTTQRNVRTGLRGQNGLIEIISGLQEGEQVVINNQ